MMRTVLFSKTSRFDMGLCEDGDLVSGGSWRRQSIADTQQEGAIGLCFDFCIHGVWENGKHGDFNIG
jgi:hypothetical protein